jgi:hypothetical protein
VCLWRCQIRKLVEEVNQSRRRALSTDGRRTKEVTSVESESSVSWRLSSMSTSRRRRARSHTGTADSGDDGDDVGRGDDAALLEETTRAVAAVRDENVSLREQLAGARKALDTASSLHRRLQAEAAARLRDLTDELSVLRGASDSDAVSRSEAITALQNQVKTLECGKMFHETEIAHMLQRIQELGECVGAMTLERETHITELRRLEDGAAAHDAVVSDLRRENAVLRGKLDALNASHEAYVRWQSAEQAELERQVGHLIAEDVVRRDPSSAERAVAGSSNSSGSESVRRSSVFGSTSHAVSIHSTVVGVTASTSASDAVRDDVATFRGVSASRSPSRGKSPIRYPVCGCCVVEFCCCVLLCCVLLCSVVFCCVLLCSVVLCCAVLCCAVLCCAVLCCAVLCCAVLCCAVLCCAVLCCAVLCCVVLCCVVLCCALLCCAVAVAVLCCALLRYVQPAR